MLFPCLYKSLLVSFPQIQLGATVSYKLSQRVPVKALAASAFLRSLGCQKVFHSSILSRLYLTKIHPFYGPWPTSQMGQMLQHPQHPPLIRHCSLLLTPTLTYS